MSVKYPTTDENNEDDLHLEVMPMHDHVCFGTSSEEYVDVGGIPIIKWVDLDHDAVAALVGQLTSWLDRTRRTDGK